MIGFYAAGAMGQGGDPSGDPHWENVVSLLHFDGPNGSTTFTDETGKTWTAAGGAQIDTSQSMFGGASGRIPGNPGLVSSPDSNDWDFGTGDFTVEAFVRFSSFSATMTMIGNYQNNPLGWVLQRRTPGSQLVFGHGDFQLIARPWAPGNGVWQHIAVSRQGTSLRAFVDGVQQGETVTDSTNIAGSSNHMLLGALFYGSGHQQYMDGWMDEVRITKGVARYTSNFTPPSAPFPGGP